MAPLYHRSSQRENFKAGRLNSSQSQQQLFMDRGKWVEVCADTGEGGGRMALAFWMQPHICLWHFMITLSSPHCGARMPVWMKYLTEAKVIASHLWEASGCKSVTLDMHFISSLTSMHSPSDFGSETEDKCTFSGPLVPFSILFTTLSSLKEKFICRHKSHLHQEVMQWLVSDGTAKAGRMCSP